MEIVSKPDELLALHGVTEELFTTLQRWFEVPDEVTISLADIDSAVGELGEPVMIAAMAMRKLQALRLLAQPGVRTSTDVVVTIVQDLGRALMQAPAMRLKRAAATADWDAALVDLVDLADAADADDADHVAPGTVPIEADTEDPEAVRFAELHEALHRAAQAVIDASDGEIRYLE